MTLYIITKSTLYYTSFYHSNMLVHTPNTTCSQSISAKYQQTSSKDQSAFKFDKPHSK